MLLPVTFHTGASTLGNRWEPLGMTQPPGPEQALLPAGVSLEPKSLAIHMEDSHVQLLLNSINPPPFRNVSPKGQGSVS